MGIIGTKHKNFLTFRVGQHYLRQPCEVMIFPSVEALRVRRASVRGSLLIGRSWKR